VPTGSGRQRFSVLGAVAAFTNELVATTTTGTVTRETVCDLLRRIRASTRLPVTLVLDNARYQRAAEVVALAAELKIELLYLPSYSPNLNLIERLWKFMKRQCLYSRLHVDFQAMKEAVEKCIGEIQSRQHVRRLETLLRPNFQMFDEVPTVAA
jgi:transposase